MEFKTKERTTPVEEQVQSEQEIKVSNGFYARYGKRAIDIVVSFVAIIVTLPINLLIVLGGLLTVGRPVFFKQFRAGKDNKPFRIVKVRSMTNERDENGTLLPAAERTTRFGKFIRSTSLDELFQFWNIFVGQMSLIGPRPMYMSYLDIYSDRHMMRQAVRPGLECPFYKPLDRRRSYQDQLENDVWYVQNITFKTDCILIFRLFQLVFDRRRIKLRGDASGKGFVGYDENGEALGAYLSDEERKAFWDKEAQIEAQLEAQLKNKKSKKR